MTFILQNLMTVEYSPFTPWSSTIQHFEAPRAPDHDYPLLTFRLALLLDTMTVRMLIRRGLMKDLLLSLPLASPIKYTLV